MPAVIGIAACRVVTGSYADDSLVAREPILVAHPAGLRLMRSPCSGRMQQVL